MRICSFSDKISISGRYNVLQAHLKKLNPVMHYIPCRAHSLNLVGVNAIELGSKEVGDFFLPSSYQYIHFAQPQQVDGEKWSGIQK